MASDIRTDDDTPTPSHNEDAFVRFKIHQDRKFVTLVIPHSDKLSKVCFQLFDCLVALPDGDADVGVVVIVFVVVETVLNNEPAFVLLW